MSAAALLLLTVLWLGASANDDQPMSCRPSFEVMASQLAASPYMTRDPATSERPWDIYRTPENQAWPHAEIRVSHPGANAHPAIIRRAFDATGRRETSRVTVCCWADALTCRRLGEDQGVQMRREDP